MTIWASETRRVVAGLGQQLPPLLRHGVPVQDRAHAEFDVQPLFFGRSARIGGQLVVAERRERAKARTARRPAPVRRPARARPTGSRPLLRVRSKRFIGPSFMRDSLPHRASDSSTSSLAMRHQVTAFSGRLAKVWLSFMMISTTQPRVFSRVSRSPRRMRLGVDFGHRQVGRIGLHGEDVLVAQVWRPSFPRSPRPSRRRGAGRDAARPTCQRPCSGSQQP